MNDQDANVEKGVSDSSAKKPGSFWKKPRYWFLFGVPLGGFVMFAAGAVFLGGVNYTLHKTNSLEFCISCHEMETFVFEEYKQTTHYNNASGVRASCSDCHLPHAWGPKVVKKTKKGFTEIPAKIMGTISTQEKFEAKRLELAERVWAEMRENDSAECRHCHSLESMDAEAQGRRTAKKHSLERKAEKGETCIDCHKGVAHKLPEGVSS